MLPVLALMPIIVVGIFLVLLRWPASRVMPLSYLTVLLMALGVWGIAGWQVAAASVKGLVIAFELLYIVFGAILLLNTLHESGALDSIREGFTNISPDAEKNKLSWRVHILPYLDQYPLYEQFKLDEAWDSEHNKKLLERMPDIFKLSDQTKAGHTQLVLPGGEGFMGNPRGSSRIRDMTDGPSNTIMVLSVVPEKAVPWTKPGPFKLDLEKASEILGSDLPGFLALFGDGRVESLNQNVDANKLKAILTFSGNEIINPDEFFINR